MDDAVLAAGRAPDVVARDAERARVDAFVEALSEGARGLVIRGEPGIGKTILWRHAVEQCRRAGCEVLLSRPAEEEMPLALVGLVDLFGQDEFEPAWLDAEHDPFARGRAVLQALRRRAQSQPAVVAIDDPQWLDPVSARALRYSIRRLDPEPIGVLTTARVGIDPNDPLGIGKSLPPGRCETIELGPLGLGALRRLLRGTVTSISRPTLRRIHEASGGNPLYALELARGLASDEQANRAPAGLHLPDSLQLAIEKRLETLPAELTPLLETVSALGPTSLRELRQTVPEAEIEELLPVAAQHGLLVVEEDLQVRFSHPLLGSAIYGRMSPLVRQSLHARLAEHALEADVRARHLALSTDDVDSGVAALLEEAAERAKLRGASDLAADFARHSLRLTPPEDLDTVARRGLVQIVNLAAAGEARRALALAGQLLPTLPPGPGRARTLVQRFYVGDDDIATGEAFLLRALQDAQEDELLRGQVLDILGWLRGMFRGDLLGGIGCAQEAVEIAERVQDPDLQMLATAHLAHMQALAGAPRPELMATAVALAEEIGRPRLGGGPRAWLAKQTLWAGDLPAARELIEAALADDARAGNELERPYRLYDLALLECAAGNFSAGDDIVRQGIEAARDAENSDAEGWLLYPSALVAAWLGRADEARSTAEELLRWAGRRGGLSWIVRSKSVLGVLALSEGDAERAARELLEGAELLEEMGFAQPGALPIVPDAVEALAHTVEISPARQLLARLERQAEALDNDWVRATVERCRGLVLAQEDADSAVDPLGRAAAAFDRLGHRPDAARALLARGQALMRGSHRTLASDALAEARTRFAALGASLWEARAVEELERVAPGRPAGDLTAAERRVAALVAQGLKNREIGQALFMSLATVEAHLTRIYRKLGVRSRSELTRLVAEGAVPVSAADEP